MHHKHLVYSIVGILAGLAFAAPAQFVDDEFNAGSLGAQWSWHDSTPAGSALSFTSNSLRMLSKEGSDLWMLADKACFVEQAAPAGTNWEVVTKIDNFDPRATGFKRSWNRTGFQLWQDNDHWIAIGILGNYDGTDVGVQAFWQTDSVPNRTPDSTRMQGASEYWTLNPSPMYFKIQKTPAGYSALMSNDGTTWTNVLPLVRNPETSDGSFANAKIRLYQSGGPTDGIGVCRPADFDFVRAQSLTPKVSSGCEQDEFNGTALDSSAWSFYEGVTSGSVSVSGGTLHMTPGHWQDQWDFVEKSMHVYQDAPTSSAYSVVVKAGPTDLRPYESLVEYGIMLWQDQCNWVMVGNQRSDATPATNRVEVAYKRNNLFDFAYADFGTGALPAYLQIEQNGSHYTALYSFDNVNWTRLPASGFVYPNVLKNAQVRLYTKKVFGTTAIPTAEFDWFHVVPAATAAQDWQLLE